MHFFHIYNFRFGLILAYLQLFEQDVEQFDGDSLVGPVRVAVEVHEVFKHMTKHRVPQIVAQPGNADAQHVFFLGVGFGNSIG
jgi:hypothetical protein